MPEKVEHQLNNMVLKFVWKGDAHPQVNRDTLFKPIEDGGIGILDIKARNEALDLIWLREYLELSPARPAWAFVANRLMAKAIESAARAVDPGARVNTFLQTWNVSTRKSAGLPFDLRRMIKAAGKYGVRLEALTMLMMSIRVS